MKLKLKLKLNLKPLYFVVALPQRVTVETSLSFSAWSWHDRSYAARYKRAQVKGAILK